MIRAVATMGVNASETQSAISGNNVFAITDHDGQHDVARNGIFPVLISST